VFIVVVVVVYVIVAVDFAVGNVLSTSIADTGATQLILMSATINVELFSHYYHNAPIISVPGRYYISVVLKTGDWLTNVNVDC
jgi:hypothetical protein